jgi:hypothetical protein
MDAKEKTPDYAGPAGFPVLLVSNGTQKLADAQAGLAPYSATGSAALRHQTGGHPVSAFLLQVRVIRKSLFFISPQQSIINSRSIHF